MAQINTPSHHSRMLPALAVAGTVLTWSASFVAIGFALRQIDPLPLASIRFALASVLVAPWLLWRRPTSLTRRDLVVVLISGVLGIALYNVLLNSGQATVSAAAASFIVNTQPLFMTICAVIFLKERFGRYAWLGAAIGFLGVTVIALGQPGGLSFGTGSTLILGAAACAAVYSILQRPLFARTAPFTVTSLVIVAGGAALTPWLLSGIAQASAASSDTVLAILFLAIGPGIIGQGCWTYALKSFGAAHTGQFLYLVPPGSVLLAWFVLGEAPQQSTILGGVLALAGVIVVNTFGKRR